MLTIPIIDRLTVNCKLHRMDDAVIQEMAPRHAPVEEGKSFWDGSLLGRPQNIEELYWRIAIFWQVVYFFNIRATIVDHRTVLLWRQDHISYVRLTSDIR